jgi:HK97 gp10 family phage protein
MGIQIIGLASTMAMLNAAASPDKIEDAVKKAALKLEGEAKRLCPVDTGRLRNSIETQRIDRYTYGVGTGVEYAPYVEFGTRKMRAQPYLRPAMEIVRDSLNAGWLKFGFSSV